MNGGASHTGWLYPESCRSSGAKCDGRTSAGLESTASQVEFSIAIQRTGKPRSHSATPELLTSSIKGRGPSHKSLSGSAMHRANAILSVFTLIDRRQTDRQPFVQFRLLGVGAIWKNAPAGEVPPSVNQFVSEPYPCGAYPQAIFRRVHIESCLVPGKIIVRVPSEETADAFARGQAVINFELAFQHLIADLVQLPILDAAIFRVPDSGSIFTYEREQPLARTSVCQSRFQCSRCRRFALQRFVHHAGRSTFHPGCIVGVLRWSRFQYLHLVNAFLDLL